MTDVQGEREEERYLERRRGLAKRFGWWWWDPAKALRRTCPDKTSDETIRKVVWPEFECAAFNYELASRHNVRRRYLLGKRFDRLTPKRMFELGEFWPRKWRPLWPIRFLYHAESPDLTGALRQIASEGSVLSASVARDAHVLIQPMLKRSEQKRIVRRKYAHVTGWTVPQYFTANLAACGDTTIIKAFRKHIGAQREFLNIPAPTRNTGRANRSARGLSFRKIEALDVWTRLPRKEAEATGYDDAEKRSAQREARRLFREWIEWKK